MIYKEIAEQITTLYPQLDRDQIIKILGNYNITAKENEDGEADIMDNLKKYTNAKKQEGLSLKTISNYTAEITRFAKIVRKPVRHIDVDDIQNFLCTFELKASTMNTKLYSIRSFFQWLEDRNKIAKSPARQIKPPKTEKRLPKAMTVTELETVRNACGSPRERALVEMFFSTGCRLSELANLDISEIDMNNGSVKVIGKGNKERKVYISEVTMLYLKEYLLSRGDDCKAVFITERGEPRRLCNRSIQKIVEKIKKKAGIKTNLHCHVFRHTLATMMVTRDVELYKIQKMLGHSSINTTEIYAHMKEEQLHSEHKRCIA